MGGGVGVVEEPGDVEEAAFVFEDGGLAVEGEVPDAEALSEGVAGGEGRGARAGWGGEHGTLNIEHRTLNIER